MARETSVQVGDPGDGAGPGKRASQQTRKAGAQEGTLRGSRAGGQGEDAAVR